MKSLIKNFEDIVEDEYGKWSQVCAKHVNDLKIPRHSLDDTGRGICGVDGCSNESDHYIDFNYKIHIDK